MGKLLNAATEGLIEDPDCILLYAPEGVGKTTFASKYPKVLIIGTANEKGSNKINLKDGRKRQSVSTLIEFQEILQELIDDKHGFTALAVDTINKIDELVQQHILSKYANCAGLGDIPNAKGWSEHINEHQNIIRMIRTLRDERKINIIILGHSETKQFDEPGAAKPYNRFVIAMRDKVTALYRQFVDDVIFVNYKTHLGEDKKSRPQSSDTRSAYTQRRAGWDAKTRSSLPFEFLFSYENYKEAQKKKEPETPESLKKQITGMMETIKDDEIIPAVKKGLEAAKSNVMDLIAVRDRLIEITSPADLQQG